MSISQPRLDDLRIERGDNLVSPRRSVSVAIVVAVLVVGSVAAWWLLRPQPIEVSTVVARATSHNSEFGRTVLNASGYVTARRMATVSSKITGKVLEVYVEEGVHVSAGQLLAQLDAANVQASLQLAKAQFASAQASLEEIRVRVREAQQEWDRQKALITSRVTPQSDYDHAEATALALRARLGQQEAEVSVAERSVAIWQLQADDMSIRAPFAGVVTSKNAQPGEMISPMSSGGFTRTGICTIVDMESLEIEIDVNESYINRVSAGQPVEATLDAYPDWKIPCKVIAIIPTADRQKSTVQVRVGFDQLHPRILPEMSVKVAFRDTNPAGSEPSLRTVTVPQGTLRNQDGHDVVFVVRDGRAERRAVTVTRTQSGESELNAGVSPGETIVVDPPPGLVDGATVKERKS